MYHFSVITDNLSAWNIKGLFFQKIFMCFVIVSIIDLNFSFFLEIYCIFLRSSSLCLIFGSLIHFAFLYRLYFVSSIYFVELVLKMFIKPVCIIEMLFMHFLIKISYLHFILVFLPLHAWLLALSSHFIDFVCF